MVPCPCRPPTPRRHYRQPPELHASRISFLGDAIRTYYPQSTIRSLPLTHWGLLALLWLVLTQTTTLEPQQQQATTATPPVTLLAPTTTLEPQQQQATTATPPVALL